MSDLICNGCGYNADDCTDLRWHKTMCTASIIKRIAQLEAELGDYRELRKINENIIAELKSELELERKTSKKLGRRIAELNFKLHLPKKELEEYIQSEIAKAKED